MNSTPRLTYVHSLLKKRRRAQIVQLMKGKGERKQKQVIEVKEERIAHLFVDAWHHHTKG